MRISKKPPKAKLMAKYYERLTKIFGCRQLLVPRLRLVAPRPIS